ncbi:helix-turn-helix domain-containing protein, partial [Longimycelium tulufanense]|uniref:helix-turn-helix domain-containing protein n=1 Tax=Longimycelium tulufanense TaxID=907463 RepID=UPI00227A1DC3
MQDKGTRVFRVKAVAEMFDVSVSTVYREIKAGRLDAYKIGNAIRIPEEALRAFT